MKRSVWLWSLAVLVVAFPFTASADLVPCTGVDVIEGIAYPSCQFCHLVMLIKNVIDWLIAVLTIIVAIIFVVAGYQLVTSAGNSGSKANAKVLIINTFIGFVIVLIAWFIVDFIMKSFLNEATLGPWHEIQCVDQPVSSIISRGIIEGSGVILPDGTESPAYTGSCEPITDTSNPCHPSNPKMKETFGSRVEEAAIICNKESGGAPILSRSDICCGTDGSCAGDTVNSFSGGYFQINILAHADKIPDCEPGQFYKRNGSASIQGNCVQRNARGTCTGWSCEITDRDMYNRCIQATKDADLNLSIAKKLFDNRGFKDWAWSANICKVPF